MKKRYVWMFLFVLLLLSGIVFHQGIYRFFRNNLVVTFGGISLSDPAALRISHNKNASETIKIALLGPWEFYRKNGFILDRAIQLAFDEINASGGILGKRMIPVWMDNQNYSAIAQEQVEDLINDPTSFAVIGPVTSGRVLQFSNLLTDSALIEVAPVAQSERINAGEVNHLLFMPIASDAAESLALAEWASSAGRDNFIILNDDSRFSMSYGSCVEQAFFEKGLTVYGRVLFDRHSKHNYVRDQLLEYLNFFPVQNMVYVSATGSGTDYRELLDGMTDRLEGMAVYFNEFITLDRLMKYAEKPERIYLPVIIPLTEENGAVLRKFLKLEGYERETLSLSCYRAVYLLADAITQAGSLDIGEISGIMRSKPLATPLGEFRFDGRGFESDSPVEILSVVELDSRWKAIAAGSN